MVKTHHLIFWGSVEKLSPLPKAMVCPSLQTSSPPSTAAPAAHRVRSVAGTSCDSRAGIDPLTTSSEVFLRIWGQNFIKLILEMNDHVIVCLWIYVLYIYTFDYDYDMSLNMNLRLRWKNATWLACGASIFNLPKGFTPGIRMPKSKGMPR